MPSSPEATPMRLDTLVAGAPPVATFALPAFQTQLPTAPSVRAFALAGGATIPPEILASATATATASARATGYAEGWAKGMADARAATEEQLVAGDAAIAQRAADAERALAALGAAAQILEQRAVTSATDIEEQIVTAAWAIATALIGDVLGDDEPRSTAAVTRALALAPSDEDVEVSVNPDDYEILVRIAGDTKEDAPPPAVLSQRRGSHTVTITPDANLTPGDATARCGATSIDARLATAVDRVRKVLGQ